MSYQPLPYGALPSAAQLNWQRLERSLFVHFTVNPFTNREWGDGTEDPKIFNPTDCDPRQWARVARDAGFKHMVLTAKHHDGFCLWPSKFTDHSIKNSPYRNGKGDLVREFVDACREFGILPGLYLSPWDRHEKSYGDSDRYNDYFVNQLTELLTQYGTIHEMWFDGACAEGPNGKRQVYDWPRFFGTVRHFAPEAIMFSDAGPDVRWVANERGFAGDPCWSTIDTSIGAKPGDFSDRIRESLHHGDRGGDLWRPPESDVSIRHGWFWHEAENNRVRTPENLVDLYFRSVGRNSLILLNIPPDTRGRFHENDVASVLKFNQNLQSIFANDFAAGRPATASNVRAADTVFAASHVTDNHPESYWATDDGITTGWVEIDLGAPHTFNIICLQEQIRLGQRVVKHSIQILEGTTWRTIVSGTTIGHKRLHGIAPATAQRVRLSIDESLACPTILRVSLYHSDLVTNEMIDETLMKKREDNIWADDVPPVK